jgi:hypothetical protein
MDKKDREALFEQQRKDRGWDDSDTWSLNSSLAQWFLPRLKRFREISIAHPHNITSDEWNDLLDQMIIGFETFLEDNYIGDQSKVDKIDRALDIFKEWFYHLWW